jgi:DNA (cytosine-5)-methyltransferase 1
MNEGIVSGFYDTTHAPNIIERYLELEPGKIDTISKSKKLQWNGFCPTLRAGTGADKGSFQAVRPIHPQQGRVITVREAARLQGFPDWFGFHHTKWHSFRMIGNSVSPIFSKALLSIIKENIISENTAITKLEENTNA